MKTKLTRIFFHPVLIGIYFFFIVILTGLTLIPPLLKDYIVEKGSKLTNRQLEIKKLDINLD